MRSDQNEGSLYDAALGFDQFVADYLEPLVDSIQDPIAASFQEREIEVADYRFLNGVLEEAVTSWLPLAVAGGLFPRDDVEEWIERHRVELPSEVQATRPSIVEQRLPRQELTATPSSSSTSTRNLRRLRLILYELAVSPSMDTAAHECMARLLFEEDGEWNDRLSSIQREVDLVRDEDQLAQMLSTLPDWITEGAYIHSGMISSLIEVVTSSRGLTSEHSDAADMLVAEHPLEHDRLAEVLFDGTVARLLRVQAACVPEFRVQTMDFPRPRISIGPAQSLSQVERRLLHNALWRIAPEQSRTMQRISAIRRLLESFLPLFGARPSSRGSWHLA